MVLFFYTGANQHLGEQKDSAKSLGGLISSSPLQNDMLGNLFSDITEEVIKNDASETKAIALFNNTSDALNNLKISYIYPIDVIAKIEIATTAIANNSGGKPEMETIPNSASKPVFANFVEADKDGMVDNTQNLGSLASGDYLGFWLRRTLLSSASDKKTCEQLNEDFEDGIDISKKEDIVVCLQWD